MDPKHKIIERIIQKQHRLLKRTGRWQQTKTKTDNIIFAYWDIKTSIHDRKIKNELYKYIPIAIVACIEGWFRLTVADLIDHNPNFLNNLKTHKALKTKYDLDVILALQEKSITLGNFIAHSIRVNKLDDIIGNLSLISGKDFVQLFEKVRIQPHHKHTMAAFFGTDNIFRGIQEAFEMRHIFCHELATSYKYKVQSIENCAYDCLLFLIGAEGAAQILLGR
ncbi:hypothetical protein KAW96_00410 [candidate division WOR-3 bacterium]|nr:hypothetical protein [candidate division WOR-3 bacterium]